MTGEEIYDALPPKDQVFIDLVAEGVGRGKAWTKSGRTDKSGSASAAATRKLNDGKMKAALEWRKRRAAEEAGIDLYRWCREVRRLALADLGDIEDYVEGRCSLSDVPEAARRTISEVTIDKDGNRKVKLHSKIAALTLAGKTLGVTPERVSISGVADLSKLLGEDEVAVREVTEKMAERRAAEK